MDIKQLVNSITPEVYANLKYSIEIGKWPDGKVMSEEQKALSIQAIIAYEAILPAEQRSGYLPPKNTPCAPEGAEYRPLTWKN